MILCANPSSMRLWRRLGAEPLLTPQPALGLWRLEAIEPEVLEVGVVRSARLLREERLSDARPLGGVHLSASAEDGHPPERQRLIEQWFPMRGAILRAQLAARGL